MVRAASAMVAPQGRERAPAIRTSRRYQQPALAHDILKFQRRGGFHLLKELAFDRADQPDLDHIAVPLQAHCGPVIPITNGEHPPVCVGEHPHPGKGNGQAEGPPPPCAPRPHRSPVPIARIHPRPQGFTTIAQAAPRS